MSDAAAQGGVREGSIPEELPREAIAQVAGRLLPGEEDLPGRTTLRLRVRDERIGVRELGAYLSLIDRLYGRLRPGGLRSYAQLASEQLRFRRIASADSAVLEIEEEVEWARPWRIAILYLALKLLPAVVDGSASWAEAARSLRDGTRTGTVQVGLFSAADGSLRGRLGEEPELADMRPSVLEALAAFLEDLYAAEGDALPPALRFAQAAVLDVALGLGDT